MFAALHMRVANESDSRRRLHFFDHRCLRGTAESVMLAVAHPFEPKKDSRGPYLKLCFVAGPANDGVKALLIHRFL
jgi:hypothetical protein